MLKDGRELDLRLAHIGKLGQSEACRVPAVTGRVVTPNPLSST